VTWAALESVKTLSTDIRLLKDINENAIATVRVYTNKQENGSIQPDVQDKEIFVTHIERALDKVSTEEFQFMG